VKFWRRLRCHHDWKAILTKGGTAGIWLCDSCEKLTRMTRWEFWAYSLGKIDTPWRLF